MWFGINTQVRTAIPTAQQDCASRSQLHSSSALQKKVSAASPRDLVEQAWDDQGKTFQEKIAKKAAWITIIENAKATERAAKELT